MKINEIEHWAFTILEMVESGQPVEDSRVELKSTWISPEKASRRIAGHANAAKGLPVLWIIGIDEEKGITGVAANEFSDWYNKVKSQFDGPVPTVTSVCIKHDDKTCVALLFETDMAPFVVRNPVFGLQGGGPVEWEVPWREGTSIRTAHRSELLKLILPTTGLPKVEVTGGILRAKLQNNELEWSLRLFLYFEPISNDRVVILFHRCRGELLFPNTGSEPYQFDRIDLEGEEIGWAEKRKDQPPFLWKKVITYKSKTIENTFDELFITGPGQSFLNGVCTTNVLDLKQCFVANIKLQLAFSNATVDLPITLTLYRLSGVTDSVYYFHWYKDTAFDKDNGGIIAET